MWHWLVHSIMLVVIAFLLVDNLTFCWSRRMYQILYRINYSVKGWVIFFDVNDLKKVNDILGHKEGDKVLVHVGKTLAKASRGRAFRYGGDEFAVLVFSRDYAKAEAIINNFKKESRIKVAHGIGLTEQEADTKMYQMKKGQKN
jgi:diguanylate cyclase (GGDEF)-like protein